MEKKWHKMLLAASSNEVSCEQQQSTNDGFALAVDLGTTNICIAATEANSGKTVTALTAKNPQAAVGTEVITRLNYAADAEEQAKKLKSMLAETLRDGVVALSEYGVLADRISKVAVVGNSAMLLILCGHGFRQLLDPSTWMQSIEVVMQDESDFKRELGLGIECQFEIVQPIGGFVGSDLLTGLLEVKMLELTEVTALIDFGTNSEIALWDGSNLLVTSAAGGPAFEGSGISCGMPAISGAVYKISEAGENEWRYETIDGTPPKGVCGSGLIDALTLLVKSGKVSASGRINEHGAHSVALPNSSFSLTNKDIDTLQRAKAAIGAALSSLCQIASVEAKSIKNLFIAGAFGSYINRQNGVLLGLLPKLPEANILVCGNTALFGCQKVLQCAEAKQQQKQIHTKVQITNLATYEPFEKLYFEHLKLKEWSF